MTVVSRGLMSYLRYLCLFAYGGVQHILCCVFCFFFLRLVYPMLPVSLDCPFLIAPSVFSKKSLKIPKGQSESVYRRTQWPKEKVQKDKQRSTKHTKHTYKTNDRVTRTPLKTGGELRCSGRVSSSCSTSLYRNPIAIANLVPNMFGCKSESIIISLFSIWICVIQS